MFNIENKLLHTNGLYDIISNFTSLINDGDNDIIYMGTNKFGSKILGSILFEDDEEFYLRYVHTLISDDDLNSFFNQKLTLRNLIVKNDTVFIVDKKYNGEILNTALISINEFPEDFLPLENSLCPKFVKDNSLEYTFSLHGELADLHKAEPTSVSETNNKVFKLLKSATTFLEELGFSPKIYSEVALAGSYELNYTINLKEKINLFSKSNFDISKFISDFLSYLFNTLPSESDNVIKKDVIDSKQFLSIKEELKNIYDVRQNYISEDYTENRLIELINYSVDSLKDFNYNGFTSIEVKNKLNSNEKLPIAIIKESFYEDVINKVYDVEIEKKNDIISFDEQSKNYIIQVYSFNKETGKGYSYYNTNETINKVAIHLKGKEDYHNTEFTRSLDENVKIEIYGIGKWVNGILKVITIDL